MGPNSEEALPAQNPDFAEPVGGSFSFADGEGGRRTILLTIYPHEDTEVEETFEVKLQLVRGEARLDSRARAVTLTVSLT